MNILLINPPRIHLISWGYTGWKLDLGEISLFPPIGLMSLAGYLRKYNNIHKIKIIDAVAERYDYDTLEKKIIEFNPNIVGITSFTYTFYDVLKTAKIVKDINPRTHVCVGGAHVRFFQNETIQHQEIDSLIIGDGEIAFSELINTLNEKNESLMIKKTENIDGLIIKIGEKIIKNERIAFIENLDLLPFPAFDLLDYTKYYSPFNKDRTMGVICSSRGCPFQCTYCQVLDKRYRMRSPENIVKEIKLYYDNGIKFLYFFDDMFNIIPKRVREICQCILDNKINGLKWIFRGRIDGIDEEMLKFTKKTGCQQILFGVEDYTDEGLEKIKKRINIKQAFEVVHLVKKYGIEVSTNWIIGFPHHRTKKNIYDLIDMAIKINSDYAQFSILQLMPGCEMFDECVKEGYLSPDYWRNYVLNPKPDFKVQLYEKNFTKKELSNFYRFAHIKFYSRPTYILRSLLKVRSFYELKIKFQTAKKVLF